MKIYKRISKNTFVPVDCEKLMFKGFNSLRSYAS